MPRKELKGLTFEYPSPSVFHCVGVPATVSFNGKQWWVAIKGKNIPFTSRDAAAEYLCNLLAAHSVIALK